MPLEPARTRTVLAGVAVWFVLAAVAGAMGMLEPMRPPAPQLVLLSLTVLTLVAARVIAPLRAWVMTVDVRMMVGLHLTRFVGIYFLILYQRGDLPYAFAVPGGWGDIAVAVLAAALLISGPPTGGRRLAYMLWNVVGLADILFVVATATRLALVDSRSMAALLQFPLSLLPSFLVPLIIATHVVLFLRLRRSAPTEPPLAAAKPFAPDHEGT